MRAKPADSAALQTHTDMLKQTVVMLVQQWFSKSNLAQLASPDRHSTYGHSIDRHSTDRQRTEEHSTDRHSTDTLQTGTAQADKADMTMQTIAGH